MLLPQLRSKFEVSRKQTDLIVMFLNAVGLNNVQQVKFFLLNVVLLKFLFEDLRLHGS